MTNTIYKTSIIVEKPIGDVFYFMSNPTNFTLWSGASKVEIVKETPGRIGSEYIIIFSSFFSRSRVPIKITKYSLPHYFSFQDISTGVEFEYGFGSLEQGTEVTLACTPSTHTSFGLLNNLLTKRKLNQFLSKLKKYLEALA